MRILTKVLFVLLLTGTVPVMAHYRHLPEFPHAHPHEEVQNSQRPTRTLNGYDIAIDLVLRPVGFVGTVAGTALYIGLSPLTLISQLYPPHDSFEKLGKLLVVQPAKYTFTRSVGDYTHQSSY